MNWVRYNQVLEMIEANPQEWDQTIWRCGTQQCFAGFAEMIAARLKGELPRVFNNNQRFIPIRQIAMVFLDLSSLEAYWLFDTTRTLDDFRWVRRMHGRNEEVIQCLT